MKTVTILHQRMYHDDNHTLGYLLFDGKVNYILEDTKQDVKIDGKTRIPAGTYELKFRTELSALTLKYRNKYDWFKWHIELQDVPGFSYIYDHIGNFDTDTNGCRLHGLLPSNPRTVFIDTIESSTRAFKDYYIYVSKLLNEGVKVYTVIKDEVEA